MATAVHQRKRTGASSIRPDLATQSSKPSTDKAALLQEVGTMATGSDSMFSLHRTRSLFSFRAAPAANATANSTADEDKPAAKTLHGSAIFIALVIFMGLLCLLSTGASLVANMASRSSTAGAEEGGEDSGAQDLNNDGVISLVEKELTSSPEGLDEDIYGMGIAAIIRDSQRFAMKTEIFALRMSRLSLSILVLVFTMTLQVFLLYEMKHLVTSVSTHEARETYDKYEVAMYGNKTGHLTTTVNGYHRGVAGHFNIANFATLDDDLKDSTCQMPLSQPTFFVGVILIWTLVCVADMRRVANLAGALIIRTPTISDMSKATEDTPETGDEAVVVIGLTVTVKAIIAVFILLPRLIVAGILLWLGCRWLCGTMGFSDVLQNAVTLEFILILKEIFYNTMAPHHNKIETRNTLILPNASKSAPNAPVFLGAFAWGFISIIWVLLYVEFLQQVLPEYNWDIHDACQQYLLSVEGKSP
jgi:hypothetical protein